ncbi:MAG: hypothetical protein V2A73_06660 [Pseudomonadota bacterium]
MSDGQDVYFVTRYQKHDSIGEPLDESPSHGRVKLGLKQDRESFRRDCDFANEIPDLAEEPSCKIA